MDLDFDEEKQEFYRIIGKDPLVKEKGADIKIVSLTEKILSYVDLANMANQRHWEEVREQQAGAIEKIIKMAMDMPNLAKKKAEYAKAREFSKEANYLFDIRTKTISPDFADISQISYFIGISDESIEDPFKKLVNDFQEEYERVKHRLTLKEEFFEKSMLEKMRLAFNPLYDLHERGSYLKDLYAENIHYIRRQAELLRLVRNEERITKYCDEKYRVSDEDLKVLSGYFADQAEINGVRFRLLYGALWKQLNKIDPWREAEMMYNNIMDSFDRKENVDFSDFKEDR